MIELKSFYKCMDGKCYRDRDMCCLSCEDSDTCEEVCDGLDAAGLEAPCYWKIYVEAKKEAEDE